jgi:DNA-binding NarL/FixJ family response regulator
MKLLWADQQGWELCRLMNQDLAKTGRGVPGPVKAVCEKLLAVHKDKKQDPESSRLRKVVKGRNISLSVCGFVLPDAIGQPRILILIEQVGRRRQEAAALQAKEVFKLTTREVEVVKNLLKGWSNKEIAHDLKVSEQTVKEHLQRIMTKTASVSRTGILVHVLFI